MIICFECSAETKALIDILLKQGKYRDYSELITVSLENLSVLQREIGSKGAVVIGDTIPKATAAPSRPQPASVRSNTTAKGKGKAVRQPARAGKRVAQSRPPADMPTIFALDTVTSAHPPAVPMPADVWGSGQDVPLDRWLFGQYNRLLPAKVNCRALANLQIQNKGGVDVAEAGKLIAVNALDLGTILRALDEKLENHRDEALATAFPGADNDDQKGSDRYANQFVASVNTQGQVSGLLIDLKLVNHTGGKSTQIRLTEAGWEFARLQIRSWRLVGRREIRGSATRRQSS